MRFTFTVDFQLDRELTDQEVLQMADSWADSVFPRLVGREWEGRKRYGIRLIHCQDGGSIVVQKGSARTFVN